MFKCHQWLVALILLIFTAGRCTAQKGANVDQDIRIAKHEFAFLKYLSNEKEFTDSSKDFNLENYKERVIIRKQLEIYNADSSKICLIVRFRATSDHGDLYWGILANNLVYLFYNTKGEDFKRLQKQIDSKTMNLIKYYIKEFD
jgi:hypothetical protein